MKISDNGLNLIKKFEGCRLTAYQDAVGVWTIGYGTTNADKAITGIFIRQGLRISQETADEWLRQSVDKKYVQERVDAGRHSHQVRHDLSHRSVATNR